MTDGLGFGNEGSAYDGGINPSWNEALEYIPEDARDNVLPIFEKWDKNSQSLVEKVHSKYEPYKAFEEKGYSPDDIQMAIGIAEAIKNDPEAVWRSMGTSFGYGQDQAQNQGQGSSQQDVQSQAKENANNGAGGFELPETVREQLSKLEQGQETMAQIILQKQEEEKRAQQDAALREEIEALKAQHGPFNERFVLNEMYNGSSPQDAIEAYNAMKQEILADSNRPKPPRLLGGGNGSGMPGEQKIDVTKLANKDVNRLVAEHLAAMKAHQQ